MATPAPVKKKPINSRRKGIAAERELKNMLKASFPQLADQLVRNLVQSERGGHDLLGLPGFAPECKALSPSHWSLTECWAQTVGQAERVGGIPVLFRKVPLRGWRVYLHLADLAPQLGLGNRHSLAGVVCLNYEAFTRFATHYHANHLGL